MSSLIRCDLCGREGHRLREVAERVVAWTEAVRATAGIPEWDSINRCLDFQACRARVEAEGRSWPVRDAVTRPTVTRREKREEVPV